jgi:hypothetical protein
VCKRRRGIAFEGLEQRVIPDMGERNKRQKEQSYGKLSNLDNLRSGFAPVALELFPDEGMYLIVVSKLLNNPQICSGKRCTQTKSHKPS